MDLKTFGARLRQLREAAKLTQAQLAAQTGLSQSGIAHWEVGDREPGITAAVALATALGIGVEVLLAEPGSVPKVKRGRPRKAKPPDQAEPKPKKPQRKGKADK